jgi:hypothetical protein
MKDLQREILNQVASGAISAEEGASRLEALEAAPALPPPAPAAITTVRQVKVVSRFCNAAVIGDRSVATAVAEGPHKVRQDGDTMVIEQSPITDDTSFEFSRPQGRVIINGFDFARKLTVRVNPDLALSATVQAGNLRVEGMRGKITAEVQAGNCKVDDFRGPINLAVTAGNVAASGRIDGGASSVRCEMGAAKVNLDRASSVRITARTSLGKIRIEGDGISQSVDNRESRSTTVGGGAGTLDMECSMGNVQVVIG